jgi:hypothetical protein
MKTLIRTLAVFGMLALASRAQVVDAYWNFNGGESGSDSPASLPANITGGSMGWGNEYSESNPGFNSSHNSAERYSGASGGHNANIAITGGSSLNIDSSTYFEFTLTPDSGFQLSATSFKLGSFSDEDGPTKLTLLASTDCFSTYTTLGSPVTVSADGSWHLVAFSEISKTWTVDTPVTFRLYGYNGDGGNHNSNWRIDDVTFGVVAVPEPPTYAAMLVGVALLGLRTWRRRKSPVT